MPFCKQCRLTTTHIRPVLLVILVFISFCLYRFILRDATRDATRDVTLRSFQQDEDKENSIDAKGTSKQELVWLLSFPNSGTTYTLDMTRKVAQ